MRFFATLPILLALIVQCQSDSHRNSYNYRVDRLDPQEASLEASGVSDSGYRPATQKLAERKLIRTGMLQLKLQNEEQYLDTIEQAHGLVKQFDGYIASESIGKQEAQIILRVPDSAL